MKTKDKLLFNLLFFIVISLPCRKSKTEWRGTIEKENKITLVKNPNTPVYSENIIAFEEELSIGESELKGIFSFLTIKKGA